MNIVILLLALSRPYFPVDICQLDSTNHTHVQVTGKVTKIHTEADGDIHIRVVNQGCFVILEIIPSLPMISPKRGDTIIARGILRYDKQHKWYELHPVESIKESFKK